MKNSKFAFITLLSLMVLLCMGCSDDDPSPDPNPNPEPPDGEFQGLDTGFLLVSSVPTGRFARYTEELPSGEFDITPGQSFENLTIRDQFRNQFFLNSVISAEGVEKFIVNEEGNLESAGNIPTVGDPFPIAVESENTGYFNDRNNLNELVVFDPTTMEVTGGIDLSDAFSLEGVPFENYGGLTVRGDDIFLPYRPRLDDGQAAQDSLIYHVLDKSSNSYVKTIFLPGHVNPRVFQTRLVDEMGNIYHLTTGVQTIPQTIRPSIVKIPTGSTEFDPDYDFRPLDAVPGGNQIPIQIMDGFFYYADGIAYAFGTVIIPDSILQIVADAGGVENLTAEQLNQINVLFATEPSSAWLRLDLNAQTVEIIDDIPLSTPFSDFSAEIEDDIYFGTSSPSLDAVFRYDPDTGTSTEALRLTSGSGDISGFFDLSQND